MSNWMAKFIIDAHAHSQRFAAKFKEKTEKPDYRTLRERIMTWEPYDNAPALLLEMERYGIDMAVCLSAFHMSNEIIARQVQTYPDKFIGFCGWVETGRRAHTGEEAFSGEKAAAEIETWLQTPWFKGVGEVLLFPMGSGSWEENLRAWRPIMEVVTKYEAPILFHTGWSRYPSKLRLHDPIYVDDLAVEYPYVPFIIGHCGVQGGSYHAYPEHALMVAAKNDNVYLETSQNRPEQLERAYRDPNIGPEKMIFGTDFGASFTYERIGDKTYPHWPSTPPSRLPEHLAWNWNQIQKIDIPEEDRDKILGLNMAKLIKMDVKERILAKQNAVAQRYARPVE